MKRAVAYSNLNGGIFSGELRGRVDLARYPTAATDSLNCLSLTLGPVTRRPGTHDIAATEGNAAAHLGRFAFNNDQTYILEWTPGWLRFVQRGGLIMAGAAPYRIASPYQAPHLSAIRSAQSADIVYLACRGMRPHKLSRYGATNWTLAPVVFRDGPYRDPWPGMPAVTLLGNTMTFATAVATADWVGQCIRFQIDGSWYWRRITAYHSPTSITALVEPGADVPGLVGQTQASTSIVVNGDGSNGEIIPLPPAWHPVLSADNLRVTVNTLTLTPTLHYVVQGGGTAVRLLQPALPHVTVTIVNLLLAADPVEVVTGMISNWRAPAWGGARGWPAAVALFEQRTFWSGTDAEPLSTWASVTGDYETFSPTETDGKVLDDNGLYLIAADQEVAQIKWLMPGDNLWMGTAGGEYICRASELSEALTPANANIRPQTTEGSADVEPIRIDGAIVFVSRDGHGVHTLTYSPDADGMVTPDLTQLAEDVTEAGVVAIAWCRRPRRVLWCLLADGTLASLTYSPADQVSAWNRHTMQDAKVLSIASIPEPGGDALYLVTERAGPVGVIRRIERMADRWKPVRGETDARRAMLLDAARSRTGGTAVSVLSGLDHLNGRIVHVLADGADIPPRMVTGGAITLDQPAYVIHAGLPVAYFHETTDIDTGGPIGTGQGRAKSITGLSVLVHATVGGSIQLIADGKPQGRPTPMPLRGAADPMDTAPQLVSGWVPVDVSNSAGRALRIRIEGQNALPATILSLAIQSQVNEG